MQLFRIMLVVMAALGCANALQVSSTIHESAFVQGRGIYNKLFGGDGGYKKLRSPSEQARKDARKEHNKRVQAKAASRNPHAIKFY